MACVDRSQTCGFGHCVDHVCECTGEWTGDNCLVNPAGSSPAGIAIKVALVGFVCYNLRWSILETIRAVRSCRAKHPGKGLSAALQIGVVGCMTGFAVLLETIYSLWNVYYDANEALARVGFGFLRCSTFGICYLWGIATHPQREVLYRRLFLLLGVSVWCLDTIVMIVDWNNRSLYDNPLLLLLILPVTLLSIAVLPTVFGIPLWRKLAKMDEFHRQLKLPPLRYTATVRRIITKLIVSGILLFISVIAFSAFDVMHQGGMMYLIMVAVFEVSYISASTAIVQFIVVPPPPAPPRAAVVAEDESPRQPARRIQRRGLQHAWVGIGMGFN